MPTCFLSKLENHALVSGLVGDSWSEDNETASPPVESSEMVPFHWALSSRVLPSTQLDPTAASSIARTRSVFWYSLDTLLSFPHPCCNIPSHSSPSSCRSSASTPAAAATATAAAATAGTGVYLGSRIKCLEASSASLASPCQPFPTFFSSRCTLQ